MSTIMKPDLWALWERSQAAVAYAPEAQDPAREETESIEQPSSQQAAGKASTTMAVPGNQGDLRHSRRRQIRSNAEIVNWNSVQVKPDVAPVVDASPDGILFQSDREYSVGMELLVRFPFPCASSPKQRGTVVRVDEQPDGNKRVAVRFG